jgi:hypothetical protein
MATYIDSVANGPIKFDFLKCLNVELKADKKIKHNPDIIQQPSGRHQTVNRNVLLRIDIIQVLSLKFEQFKMFK